MQGFQHILTIGEGFNKYKLACGLTNRREVGIQIIDAIMQGDLIVGFKTILFSAHLRWEFLWPIFRAWLGTKRKTLVEWWCGKGIEKTADDWHSPSEESIVEVNLQSGPPFLSPFIELSLCFFPPCIHIYIHYTVFIYIERERERERDLGYFMPKPVQRGLPRCTEKALQCLFQFGALWSPSRRGFNPRGKDVFVSLGGHFRMALPHGRYTNKLRLAMSTFDSISTLENSMLRLAGLWWVDSQYFFWTRAYLNQASKWYVINRKMQKENHVCIDSSLVVFLCSEIWNRKINPRL